MDLNALVKEFGLTVAAAPGGLGREVTGGYASDLLSDVLAHAAEGSVWVTLHIHHNIVAVASHKDLAGIILVQGRQPDEEAVAKAEAEQIPLLVTSLPAFELIGRLYKAGIRGTTQSD
jgi:hypothetical protein